MPLFNELVSAFPGIRLNLDVKDWSSVPSLAAAIERHSLHDQVLVASFSDRRRRAVLKLLSRPVAASAGIVSNTVFTCWGRCPGPRLRRALRGVQALQVPVRYGGSGWSRRPMSGGRTHGLKVHVWTINDPAEMRRLLDIGVDGIVTDRADLLKKVLLERGEWD